MAVIKDIKGILQEWRPRRRLDSLLNAAAWLVFGLSIGFALGLFR